MALEDNGARNNFRRQQSNTTLGNYMRRNNIAWRANNFVHQPNDPRWHQYLRQQAGLPNQTGLPYGTRRKSKVGTNSQGMMVYEDDDLGISKIDFTSPPIILTWLDLQAKAPPKDKGIKRTITKALCPSKEVGQSKLLLKEVSGIAKPGQLVAIMGASGAGKTTLLNILTNRRPGNLKITGEVRVNGSKMGRNINRVAGYVQQEELFVPSMTTRQHLFFHAMLRLDRDIPKAQRLARIDEILDFLNLKKVENTVIGDPGRIKGLSGGEKRRLLFAAEILNDPPLLFADEPTSGLDGSMAFVLCDAMRKLCNQGKTIVCTIHQPSSEIFQLFDTLYLLAEGRVAYFGSRKKAEEFFSGLGFESPINYNLADFYIQTLAIVPHDRETSLERIEYVCDQYENSPIYARYVAEARQYHMIDDDQSETTGGLFKRSPKYKTSFFTQFRWLLWREAIDQFRNPFNFRLQLIVSIIVGILLGLLFLRLDYNQKAFQNISAVVVLLIINITFASVQKSSDSYSRQLPLFFKEHDDGIYRTIPYYFSKFFLETPTSALTVFLLGTIVYWMANLNSNAQRYFIYQAILILVAFVSIACGSLVGVSAPNPEAAAALLVPIILPLMVFCGFFINAKSIHDWLLWIKYISWIYYANEMAIINQWDDITSLDCSDTAANTTCFRNGTDIIKYYSFDQSHYYRNLGLLFALFGVLRLLSLIILLLRAKFQRKTG